MGATQQLLMAMGAAGSSGTGPLAPEVLADSPYLYMQLGEASGTNAENIGTASPDGTYSGSFSLGNTQLYGSGPTSLAVTSTTGRVSWPGTSVPAMTAMTLGVVYRADAISGTRQLISRDTDLGGGLLRYWQWYLTGTDIAFTKIKSGVETVSVAHGMSADTDYILHVTITAGGSVKLFRDGTLLTTGAVSGTDYGGSNGTDITVGNRHGMNEGVASDRFSDAFVIASAISDTRVADQAAAAGF